MRHVNRFFLTCVVVILSACAPVAGDASKSRLSTWVGSRLGSGQDAHTTMPSHSPTTKARSPSKVSEATQGVQPPVSGSEVERMMESIHQTLLTQGQVSLADLAVLIHYLRGLLAAGDLEQAFRFSLQHRTALDRIAAVHTQMKGVLTEITWQWYRSSGESAAHRGLRYTAITAYQQALALHPDDRQMGRLLADLLLEEARRYLGDPAGYPLAETFLTQSLKSGGPRRPESHVQLGRLATLRHRHLRALKHLELVDREQLNAEDQNVFDTILTQVLRASGQFFLRDGKNVLLDGQSAVEVYFWRGREEGKTALLFFGIHGDEPGSHRAGQLLTARALRPLQGNLIVVPAVNPPAIGQGRRLINHDMNRLFQDGPVAARSYEGRIVEQVLKPLMARADALINSHDGAGFHARHPMQWGQSIPIDTVASNGWDVQGTAKHVVTALNGRITNPAHHFVVANNQTFLPGRVRHADQVSSATAYFLTKYGKPAWGLETSKELPVELRVRYQLQAIASFLNELGIRVEGPLPEKPDVSPVRPTLEQVVVEVNGSSPPLQPVGPGDDPSLY